jgi:hypothetical protein
MAVKSSADRARIDGKFRVSVYSGENVVVGATSMLTLGSSHMCTIEGVRGTSVIASSRNATATAQSAVVVTGANGIDVAAAQSDLIWTAALSTSMQATQHARVEAMQNVGLGALNTDVQIQAVGTTAWTSDYSTVESGARLEVYTSQDAYANAGRTTQLVGRTDVGVQSEQGLIAVTSYHADTSLHGKSVVLSAALGSLGLRSETGASTFAAGMVGMF